MGDGKMRNILLNTMMAAALGLGTVAFAPVANAQELEFGIGRDGPQIRVRENCNPEYDDCRDVRRDGRDRRREAQRRCTEDRALDKADRMGIRRARIESAGRRTIEVRGRDRSGDRVFITFGRAPNCPILG